MSALRSGVVGRVPNTSDGRPSAVARSGSASREATTRPIESDVYAPLSLPSATCDVQQWNYEGLAFTETPPQSDGTCPVGTMPVYRAYNNAYSSGKSPWDSTHRYSTSHDDIEQLVSQFGWSDEGVVFCALE